MDIELEVKINENYTIPKIVICANNISKELSDIIDSISSINYKQLKVYKDEKLYILNQNEIETIYSEGGKVFVRCNEEIYTIKNRLYELENLLDKKSFIRISNSEIINFSKVKNIDLKILGTIVLNFESGNKAYASRRYIPKIKEFLEI